MLDRLRPKWQHSDTEVRAEAVRKLGKEDSELLSAVAQSDDDARVRRIAVKKLDDPKLLLKIGENDPDERRNAAGDPGNEPVLEELRAALRAELARVGG